MMEKEIISSRQFMIITLLFSIGTAILIIPASVASEAKQDAWIAAIIGVIISLPIVKLFVALGDKTPTLTFVEANEKILGRFFGKFTAIGFILISLLSAGELLYFIGIFMKTEIMPETPTMAFAFMFSIIIIYAAFLGIEVFARSAEILFAIFLLILFFFVLFIAPSIQIENIQPIMETPKKSLFFSIIRFISLFSFPLVILLMIFPSAVNVQKSAQKGFYIGAILGGIVLITIITLSILVLGPANTASRTFPSYALAQRISIGNFLQRIEVIMATMWIITIFIRTFMYFYAAVIGIAQICKIKNHRPLILPLGMIILGLSQIVHPNIIHSDIYNRDTWPIFAFILMILLPLLLLIVAKIRKINGNQENNTQCNSSTQNLNGNSTQSDSSSNGGNASQSASSSNNDNSAQNASNNNNSTQSDCNGNGGNAPQSTSNNNGGNASQSAGSSNNDSPSQSASNNNNSTQSDGNGDGGNAPQSTSSNNGGNASQSTSNNDNSAQSANSSNNDNTIQSDSNSNGGNASQSTSSSNNENPAQSASNSNAENTTQSKIENDTVNYTQNDSDTGNTPNSDKNKKSPDN